jgi:hypothetical protein
MATGTLPNASLGVTYLAEWIEEKWGERVNEFYRNKLVTAPFFTDRSDELSAGGSALYTPNTVEFSAAAKTVATAVTLNANSDTKNTLTIDQWYESSFAIEDNAAAQVKHSYSLMERYSKNCGYAVAKVLDTAICNLFDDFTNIVGSSTNTLGDSDIRAAFAYLETAGADVMESAFFVSPNVFWKQVQGLDKFSLAVNSPVNDPTQKMPAAYLYGRPVHITNQIITRTASCGGKVNALAVPDAIHWGTSPLGSGGSKGGMVGSMGVRVQSNYLPEYLSTVTTADILYGVVLNRATGGVGILTSTA